MTQLMGFLLVSLNIYLPVNAWISHNDGTATPLIYIGLGFSLYFWFLVLSHFLTPEEQRKQYSLIDVENIVAASIELLEQENKGETKH